MRKAKKTKMRVKRRKGKEMISFLCDSGVVAVFSSSSLLSRFSFLPPSLSLSTARKYPGSNFIFSHFQQIDLHQCSAFCVARCAKVTLLRRSKRFNHNV